MRLPVARRRDRMLSSAFTLLRAFSALSAPMFVLMRPRAPYAGTAHSSLLAAQADTAWGLPCPDFPLCDRCASSPTTDQSLLPWRDKRLSGKVFGRDGDEADPRRGRREGAVLAWI